MAPDAAPAPVALAGTKSKRELVIAMCKEDVDWINEHASDYALVTVYKKCDTAVDFKAPNIKVIHIDNIGSCDYAYLSYVIERYETLPEFVEFAKGSTPPETHFHDCKVCKTGNLKSFDRLMSFHLENHEFAHASNKNDGLDNWHGSGYKNLGAWIDSTDFLTRDLYKNNFCNIVYGGHFHSTREQIQKSPKKIWEQLRNFQKYKREEVDHFIERTWRVLLCR